MERAEIANGKICTPRMTPRTFSQSGYLSYPIRSNNFIWLW